MILKKFQKTGLIQHVNTKKPMIGDFTNLPSYQEALDYVNKAEATFMSLTAEQRERFNNNPQKFLDFATKPENADELVKLGLAEKKVVVKETTLKDVVEAVKANAPKS